MSEMIPRITVLDVVSADPRGCQGPDSCPRRADFRIVTEGRTEELCEYCAGMRLSQDRQRREGGDGAWHRPTM